MKKMKINVIYAAFAGILLTVVSCSKNNSYSPDFPELDTSSVLQNVMELHFFVLGDWGYGGSLNQLSISREMANIARKEKVDFIVTCGDNFYYSGVQSVNDSLWKLNFENIYTDSSLQVNWYPALGNHDYNGNIEAQIEYSNINKRWKMPANYYTYFKRCKSFSVEFIVLDTEELIEKYQALEDSSKLEELEQLQWLNKIFEQDSSTYTIVYGHHSIYSSGEHGNSPVLQSLLVPLFQKYKVDLFLSGHDHNFEHLHPRNQLTNYIVNGSSGALRPVEGKENSIFAISEIGFSYLKVNEKLIEIEFINTDGKIVYDYKQYK